MKQLKTMKDTLINSVQNQMCNLAAVDTKELGEVIDMIKDLSEAIYYCTVTEAMEEKDLAKEHHLPKAEYPYRDMDKEMGRMYYNGGGRSGGSSGGRGNSYYTEREYPIEMRDYREGRSPQSRRMYMEAKELHEGKEVKVKELEKYMQELTRDITEMIEDASLEEKQMLYKKMNTLAAKINNV